MRIAITGGKGMLGRTLRRRLAGHELMVADLPEVDILDLKGLTAAFNEFSPDVVVHCAAMTKVDDCETKDELAFRLNGTGSANVAYACSKCGARLIAVSTDYVFSGDLEAGKEWRETDAPSPRTIYGASKLAGEKAVHEILPSAVVMRIAWLYGSAAIPRARTQWRGLSSSCWAIPKWAASCTPHARECARGAISRRRFSACWD